MNDDNPKFYNELLVWSILKVFIEFITILFLFIVWFFGYKACGGLSFLTWD